MTSFHSGNTAALAPAAAMTSSGASALRGMLSIIGLCAAVVCGCSGDAGDASDPVAVPSRAGAAGEGSRERASESDEAPAGDAPAEGIPGVLSDEAAGALIFWHDNPDHGDALLDGAASIEGGCLVIGEHVVIWHESRLADARGLVDALLQSRPLEDVSLGGGEGVVLASALTDRCADRRLWFSSPLGD